MQKKTRNFKKRMRSELDLKIQVSRWRPFHCRITKTCQPDMLALPDTRWNLYVDRAFLLFQMTISGNHRNSQRKLPLCTSKGIFEIAAAM